MRVPSGRWGPPNRIGRGSGAEPVALLGSWQRQALTEAVPSSAERDEIKRFRAELRRVEQERDIVLIDNSMILRGSQNNNYLHFFSGPLGYL